MFRSLSPVVALVAPVLMLAGPAAGTASADRPVLGVVDGRIVDRSGEHPVPIQLRGVNRSGTEHACASGSDGTPGKRGYAIFNGPTYDSRYDVAQPEWVLDRMQSWGVKTVRVPLSDACWFGDDPTLNTKYSGGV